MKGIEGKIKRIRNDNGLSKAYMSRACDITPTAYSNIEDDITDSINIETGRKIAKALGVSFNELFEIEGDSQKIDALNKQIERLNERVKELKMQIEDKDSLLLYFSRTNKNVRNFLIKRMNEFIAKLDDPEKLNEEKDVWRLSEILKIQFEDFVYLGVLEQSDVDDAVKINKGK